MPTIPKQIKCITLGCKNPKAKYGGFCLEHGGRDAYRAKSSDERKEFNSMYQTQMWRTFRQTQLSKQPLCQGCLSAGHIRSAAHVDHLFAWADIGKTAFYLNIFQCLCANCHSAKSGLEKRGIYRHYHDQTHHDYRVEDYKQVVNAYMRGETLPVECK